VITLILISIKKVLKM